MATFEIVCIRCKGYFEGKSRKPHYCPMCREIVHKEHDKQRNARVRANASKPVINNNERVSAPPKPSVVKKVQQWVNPQGSTKVGSERRTEANMNLLRLQTDNWDERRGMEHRTVPCITCAKCHRKEYACRCPKEYAK